MALSLPTMFSGLLGLLLMCLVWWLLELLWWKPRRLERVLRAQGLAGTSYHALTGDLKDDNQLKKEALSRPLPLRCHDIAPRILPLLYKNVQVHGKICLSWSGPIPTVAMCDPALVKEMLSDKLGHFGMPQFPAVNKMLNNGLGQHEGEKWAQHRKIINPAFSLQEIKAPLPTWVPCTIDSFYSLLRKHTLPAFSACCEEMVSKWMECLGSKDTCEVDVWPDLNKLSGDAISRTAFSSSYLEGRRVFELLSEQIKRLVSTFLTILVPGYLYLPTKNNRRMHQIKKEIESILRGLIGRRVQEMEDGICTKQDILGLLLESNMRNADEKGQPIPVMTIEEIIEHCKLFYFAGSDTTAILLTWTMVALSMHPEWQVSARKEVIGLFGKNKPKYEDLSRLKTVTMILHEVLRLYPPAPMMKRKTCKDVEIGGVRYPAGLLFDIPVLLIHHDPDIWGIDVHEFRPERFAEGISKASKFQGAFLPFSSGPRICIGQNFAMLEAKLALCTILQHFEFELAPTYTHAPHFLITLEPMHGAPINLRAI